VKYEAIMAKKQTKKKREWVGLAVGGGVIFLIVGVILFCMLAVPVMQAKKTLREVTDRFATFSVGDMLTLSDPYIDDVGVIPREAESVLMEEEARVWIDKLLPLLENASGGKRDQSLTGRWEPNITMRSGAGQVSVYLGQNEIYVSDTKACYVFTMDEQADSYQAFCAELDIYLHEHIIEAVY